MSRSKKTVDVSQDLMKYYKETLQLTNEKLAKEVNLVRFKDNEDRKKRPAAEAYEVGIAKGSGKVEGPSVSAIARMIRDGRATEELGGDVLRTLQLLVMKEHDDPKSPYNPENLPIPTSLSMPVPKERNSVVDDSKDNSTEPAKLDDMGLSTSATHSSEYDGICFDKKRLTLFEMIYELGQSIRNTDSARNLYAAVHTGTVLHCLMTGIADVEKRALNWVVVRQREISSDSERWRCPRSIKFLNQYALSPANFGQHHQIEFHIVEVPYCEEWPDINAYMYGKSVIYVREHPRAFDLCDYKTREGEIICPGDYPVNATCIRLTDQDEDTELFKRYYDFLVHGKYGSQSDDCTPWLKPC